ncbi:hypothetical protein N7510_010358 [Penicillium lagena]|uniref:uncharacterized protein n=1 Tax=Penicillium lagena TaxID=94218 RepID=UPI00254244D9|nr:uncharacterized protein N7510_010358 [Penicillium lagena]KAJ5605204.1 hypothetical protein N7510_010358 [Penicillium lagena]
MAHPSDQFDQVNPGNSIATTNDVFWPWTPTAEVHYGVSPNNNAYFIQLPSTNPSFSSQPVSPGTPAPPPLVGGRGSSPNVAWNKVAIPRAPNATTINHRRRSQRACESCRQRKIKCDGNRPSCRQCIDHSQQCSYEDVKRVRDQKRLGSLSKRVDQYESLLRELEVDADASTARKIRKALKGPVTALSTQKVKEEEDDSSSIGSLDGIDMVEEDLNRSENSRAAGFFGKASEIAWMRNLADDIEKKGVTEDSVFKGIDYGQQISAGTGSTSISRVNYHMDDLEIPFVDPSDPSVVPSRDLADRYLEAYFTFVHPTFNIICKAHFEDQYHQFLDQGYTPHRKWMALLNMIFAIGCRYCRLTDVSHAQEDDFVFLTRARKLGLHPHVLFEHSDLQQIQLELLVAVYLLCLGQLNRACKFSHMAARSGLILGVNLRMENVQTPKDFRETRYRLWWTIFSLECLLSSMTGRASCVDESISSVPAPLPFDEESFTQPAVNQLLKDQRLRESQLQPTMQEPAAQLQDQASASSWTATCTPSRSLFFHCLVDLSVITQSIISKVYSIEGMRLGSTQIENRMHNYGLRLDKWLAKLPPDYQFIDPESSSSWYPNRASLIDDNAQYTRERVSLAMNYYSARMTLCRPCFTIPMPQSSSAASSTAQSSSSSHVPSSYQPAAHSHSSSSSVRAELATQCLQAACSLISNLPESPSLSWLARTAPWWSVLHFLMQATTALLLGLSSCSLSFPFPHNTKANVNDSAHPAKAMATLETDLSTAVAHTRKALFWIHAMAAVDPASKRAFGLCAAVVRKIAPRLGLDLSSWPDECVVDSGPEGESDGVAAKMV